ncbi:MAG: hypothetical protein HQ534_03475 [Armatimonadetes bacterium]|nr:hypothetical protein [Armatimonadota bacterium]
MKKDDKSSWIVGGCSLIGIGVGFIFLTTNVFYFIASILVGIGLGLLIASFISKKKEC